MYNNWASKRYSRSVKELCLWGDNPRLDPEQEYKYLRDYFDNIVTDSSDKQNFMNLVKSIAEKGFISIDPIVTYKDNNRLIVAEGNRRVLALKILLEPQKSPIKYRKQIKIQSDKIKDKPIISKIPVIIAPSFDDTVWYINERNSISTLKQSWSRIQQHQWYYDEYMRRNKNIEEVANDFNMTKSELENIIRFVKIRNLIKQEEVKEILTNKEYKMAIAINFPITILERFFSSAIVQEKWSINFDGENLKIKNNKDFMDAFKYLIKNIVSKDTTIKIDTRTVTSSLDKILDHLPKVDTNIEGYNDSNINHYKKFSIQNKL
ncbi:ParB/Srx family N-terminal domain-containing protein [Campylobacter curvus]|uniref:ParB/Srx family N-terminal domain-containing protein n=1 Tax=Campylobacter curvus TaxID=200 RepID=UPI00147041C1|nr:ParB/Srx family N-terminal domain-containing protein [Campylobacter curvus]